MRASRVLVILIVANVVLGVFAAGVILSPEYAALDAAIRKGASLPPPPDEVLADALLERPWFVTGSVSDALRELRPQPHRLWLAGPECHRLCRFRRVVAIALRSAFESDQTMLRAYIATR
ncbi:MAG: hypothetical protein ACXWH7_12435 [Thermoanaerobaculia bacterium]